MDQHLMLILQGAASVLSGLIVLAALVLLWWKSHSPWLLLAIAAEGISVLFRIAFSVAASALGGIPILLLIFPLTGLLVGAGLFGYALDEASKRP
jgi:hypothetical protein